MTQEKPWDTITLKLWHGGCFKRGDNGVVYLGSTFRTVGIDPDEMCWFTLVEEAEKCGFITDVDGIFFMSPSDGLQRATGDTHAGVICKKALDERVGECYIVPGCDVPHLMQLLESGNGNTLMKMPCKMIPRRKGSTSIKGPPLSSSALSNTKSTCTGQQSNKKSSQISTLETTNTKQSSNKNTTKAKKPVGKTKKEASQKTAIVVRTSPRFTSSQLTSPPSSPDITVHTSNKASSPDIIVHTSKKSSSPDINEHPEPSYNLNDLTLADLFNDLWEVAVDQQASWLRDKKDQQLKKQ